MNYEAQLITSWIQSQDPEYISKLGLKPEYFYAYKNEVVWILGYLKKYGELPTLSILKQEFGFSEEFMEGSSAFVADKIKEAKIYADLREILVNSAKMAEDGKSLSALSYLKSSIEKIEDNSNTIQAYSWTQDVDSRLEAMKQQCELIPTGIVGLDEIFGGWDKDDFIVLAGRTNEGKSYLSLYFAYCAWKYACRKGLDSPIVYISTEMPCSEVAYRLDTLEAHFSNTNIQRHTVDYTKYSEYLYRLKQSTTPLEIYNNVSTVSQIRTIISTKKPLFIVIDQLYDIDSDIKESDIRKRIIDVTKQLRDINLHSQVPMLVVTQANRSSVKVSKQKDVETETPELHEIQESDNPVQKATKVLTLRMIDDNTMKISVKKARESARNKSIFMRIDFEYGIWEESTAEEIVF